MRLVYIIFITFVFTSFTGCSSKDAKPQTDEVSVVELSQEDSDEFAEFDEELEVEEISDPFSGYNRGMTSFNDGFYEYVFKPVNNGYVAITHKEVRSSIDKFFTNLYFPMRFINNILQGKFANATEETGRFLINTTIGLLGLFDPAKSEFDLDAHNEDFGQTLGFYGVGAGPHIVLPFFGPSNLRDFLSMAPDAAVSVWSFEERDYMVDFTDTWPEYLGVKSVEYFNRMSLHSTEYDMIREDAVDLYPYLRDMYEQKRAREIEE